MGDPKKLKKKYQTPTHPWQKSRMEEETALIKEYGLKNKKEIWKMQSILRNFSDQTKKLIGSVGEQAEKEKQQLMAKLQKYGLLSSEAHLEDTLGLSLRDLLERRLQTQVYKKNFARSIKQARQFIIHHHVVVGGTKIGTPSYLVSIEEEPLIGFVANSALSDPEHPERQIVSESEIKKKTKAEEKAGSEEKKEEKKEKPKEEVKPKEKKEEPKAEKKPEEKKEEAKPEEKPVEEEPKEEVKE